jgi:hypothetical protein
MGFWAKETACECGAQFWHNSGEEGGGSERATDGWATLIEAAKACGTSMATVQRMITKGLLEAQQACKGASWVIKAEALAEGLEF